MSETGISISEARPSINQAHRISPSEAPVNPGNQPHQRKLMERLKSIGLKLMSEKPFKPEDFTTDAVARDIATYLKNPLLERAGRNPYANGFDIKTLLSNIGHTRDMNNPNSPAYQAARQALHGLARDGVLEAQRLAEPNQGEWQRYYVADVDLLTKAGQPPQESQNS